MKRLAIALGAIFVLSTAVEADTNELRIAKQPGLSYLPAVIAEKLQLVEKHARAAGLADFKTTWTRLTNGGASNDALLSGNVDMVISGGPNMLILWAKTNGRVKGVVATGALPMLLVTNNPNVKTIADFTEADRIAVPTIRVGTQPAVLGIAVEKQFGLAQVERYNSLTVSLGHPDAMIALQAKGSGGITAHFSQPPYQNQELKIPGVHTVLNSFDVVGGGMTNGCFYSTTEFRDKNPVVVKALVDAIKEAIELIKADKRRAAEIYLEVNKESIGQDELTEILNQPDMIYSAAPLALLQAAQFFSRAGYIKQKPTDWKEFFFPEVHDLNGS
ncbi:MAG: ABC transporter substrate-binding protein [Methylobacteriaceae bacterium]|nr:ABC transporter substrate-binding protein [Methylobacteriaceae bacterium]